MAVTSTPALVQNPKITPQSFVNSDGTTKKTIATGGSNGSKLVSLIATSTDTGTRILQLFLTRSAVNYLLGSTLIAIGAGTDGVASSSNLLTSIPGLPLDNDGQPYIFLESGDTLTAAVTVAVTAAKEIDVHAIFGNF
jgi:hypothetical protein